LGFAQKRAFIARFVMEIRLTYGPKRMDMVFKLDELELVRK